MNFWSKFISESKRPYNLVMLAIALIAIAISIGLAFVADYYYRHPVEKKKQITYAIHPISTIYNPFTNSDITLFDKDNKIINHSVYSLSCWFQNTGKEEIEPKDVRVPIRIIIPNATKILSVLITGVETTPPAVPSIDNFHLAIEPQISSDLKRGGSSLSVQLTWDHFDPGTSIDFYITFVADNKSHIRDSDYNPADDLSQLVRVEGHIFGINELMNKSNLFKKIPAYINSPAPLGRRILDLSLSLLPLYVIGGVGMFLMYSQFKSKLKQL